MENPLFSPLCYDSLRSLCAGFFLGGTSYGLLSVLDFRFFDDCVSKLVLLEIEILLFGLLVRSGLNADFMEYNVRSRFVIASYMFEDFNS